MGRCAKVIFLLHKTSFIWVILRLYSKFQSFTVPETGQKVIVHVVDYDYFSVQLLVQNQPIRVLSLYIYDKNFMIFCLKLKRKIFV